MSIGGPALSGHCCCVRLLPAAAVIATAKAQCRFVPGALVERPLRSLRERAVTVQTERVCANPLDARDKVVA